MRQRLGEEMSACDHGRLPGDYCGRLLNAQSALQDADLERARREASSASKGRQRDTERQAERERRERAQAERDRAADAFERAWSALDLTACRAGDPAACYEITRFREEYPRSEHDQAAADAVAAGGAIVWEREHAPDSGMEDLERRVSRDMEKGRARDEQEFRKQRVTGAACCDGTPLSGKCLAGRLRGCCSRHGGVCPGQSGPMPGEAP